MLSVRYSGLLSIFKDFFTILHFTLGKKKPKRKSGWRLCDVYDSRSMITTSIYLLPSPYQTSSSSLITNELIGKMTHTESHFRPNIRPTLQEVIPLRGQQSKQKLFCGSSCRQFFCLFFLFFPLLEHFPPVFNQDDSKPVFGSGIGCRALSQTSHRTPHAC